MRPRRRAGLAGLAGLFCAALLGCVTPEGHTPTGPAASASVSAPLRPEVPAATDVHLGSHVKPERYELALTVDPRRKTFNGSVKIALAIDEPTATIVLHGRDLKIGSATLTPKGAPAGSALRLETATRPAFGAREDADELVLLVPSTVQGAQTLEIAYEAPFGVLAGLYRVESEGSAYAFTQLEPIDARAMFPCFDEPSFKTPFAITVSVPHGMIAVSNGAEKRRREAEGWVRFEFQETAPLPSYLVALAVGDLELADGPPIGKTPLRMVATRGKTQLGGEALAAANASLSALERYFERPYPFGKLDLAAVPNFGPGAMENAGLVTFREELVLTNARSSSLMRRRMQAVMAHELAHQWFGNLVTMRFWDDLWLNEGFATWMQGKICDQAFPGFGARTERALERNYALNADVLPAARAVRPRVDTSDQIREAGGWSAYQKGAAILFMLESWAGEVAFRDGIRAYVAANADRSIRSGDLLFALETSTKLPMSKVAKSFLEQPGVPLVDVKVAGACEGASVTAPIGAKAASKETSRITLRQSDLADRGRSWAVPVCLHVEGEAAPRCTLLEDREVTLDGPPGCPWVHPNADEAGYYRYRLDQGAATRLRKALPKLSEPERVGLLLDSWALFLSGKGTLEPVVRLLEGLELPRASSRVLIDAAIFVLADMDRVLVDEGDRAAFSAFVRRLLKRPTLPKDGAAESAEDRLRRVSLLGALSDLGDDPAVAPLLEPLAEDYVQRGLYGDPDLVPLALRVSARRGRSAASLDLDRLAKAADADERIALEAALASKGDAAALRKALDGLADGRIRGGDFRHLRQAALRRRDSRAVFYAFVRERFDELSERIGGAGGLTSTLREICDPEELARMKGFFGPKLARLAGAQRGFDEGVAEAERCIALRGAHKGELGPLLKP